MALNRLMVIGFDAMDVELLRSWAQAGYLPTFRRLFEEAAWTSYTDGPEHSSGTQWTAINTGFSPLTHDLYFARRFLGGTYRTRMGRVDDVRVDYYWRWFAEAGRRIIIADVPFVIARPEYGGSQYWGWGIHDWPGKPSSVPDGLLTSLTRRFGDYPVPQCHNYSTETTSLRLLGSRLLTGLKRRTAIFRSLITETEWDLFYGVFSETHCAGHLMWHLEDDTHPRHTREQLAAVGHALRDLYAAADRALGALLELKGPDTALAIILSHGFGPNYHGTHLFSEFLARFNRQWAGGKDCNNRTSGEGGLVNALWKASVGRLPESWRAGVKHQLPMPLRAWISTQRSQNPRRLAREPAFSLPQDGFSSLRVNMAGREPQGKIRPGEEYRHYIDTFTRELMRLTNAETGQPAVARIFRADERVDPMTMQSGTDLIIWWNKAAPIKTIDSPTLGTIEGSASDVRTGDHVMRGMLLIAHPLAGPGHRALSGMNALDIAPTLCDLAQIRPPMELPGKSRIGELLMGEYGGASHSSGSTVTGERA